MKAYQELKKDQEMLSTCFDLWSTISSFAAWQSAELWGNLISSLVLSSGAHGSGGGSSNYSDAALDLCGANFCVKQTTDNANLERPPDSEIYLISSIYLGCIVVAVIIIALFMDPLSRYGDRRRGSISAQELTGVQLLTATFKQLRKPNQQLLIPLTIFIGMEQAFIGADFTQVWKMKKLWKFAVDHELIPGLRVVRAWYPSNRLRYDLLWSRQCNLFSRFWISHEIHRQILHYCLRDCHSHGNFQLFAFLATTSRQSFGVLCHFGIVGRRRCCLADTN